MISHTDRADFIRGAIDAAARDVRPWTADAVQAVVREAIRFTARYPHSLNAARSLPRLAHEPDVSMQALGCAYWHSTQEDHPGFRALALSSIGTHLWHAAQRDSRRAA